jgi:hypothetical protein
MSSLVISGDTSGSVTLEAPSVAGSTILTLPATSGTVITSASGTAATATNLAGGSNGTIPYQSASGTTQMLAVGTSGQVLQTNGAGAPSWVTPSSGAMTFISTTTASGSATIDIALSGAYTSFQIIFYNFRPSSGTSVDLIIQFTSDAFSTATTWENTSLYGYGTGASNASTTTAGAILTNQLSGSVYYGSGTITVPNPLGSGIRKSFMGLVNGWNAGIGTPYTGMVAGINESTSALNGIRFIASSGNLTTGTFKLYGIT